MTALNTHSHWADAVHTLTEQGQDYVLVTVLGTAGSTPRDTGTKMVFSRQTSYGTIGGGNLEYKVAQIAAELIGSQHQKIEYFPLGPSLGQCCGGSTSVLFESFVGTRLHIALFGAGHVGASLAPLLQQMPCSLHWIDSREAVSATPLGANVTCVRSEEPAAEVTAMPPGSCYVIMTHNHQQDYAILKAVLARADAAYIGLIGSATKWRRFRLRLQHEGLQEEDYAPVHCPIGLADIAGKRPVEVAVSVAAQLIQHYQQQGLDDPCKGPGRRQLQAATAALTSAETDCD